MSATEAPAAAGNGHVGRSLRRKEDPRLIKGQASYVDDINLTGQLWAAWVRSPEAHAKIVSIDTSAAKARDGVVAVYTNEDLDMEAGLPMAWVPPGVDVNTPDHWVLAKGEVKHVGDPVAARHRQRPLRASSTPPRTSSSTTTRCRSSPTPRRRSRTARRSCTRSSAPTRCASGRWAAATSRPASPRPTTSSSAGSSTTASPGAAIEPRAVLADYRADRLTVYSSTQVPHFLRLFLVDHPRHQRGPRPRGRPRGRRRVRLQAADLRRGDRLRVGVAQARPAR